MSTVSPIALNTTMCHFDQANFDQAIVYPKTIIGDVNFIGHTHRGFTAGHADSIGWGRAI
jgi:hypothetical protein